MTDINKELEAIAEDVFVDEDEQLVEEPANAPTLHAEPAMPMQHMDGQDEVEDMGPAVVSPKAPSDPGKEASKKANLAPSLIAGVKDSIGPVKPRIIPTFISATAAVEIDDKLMIAARSNFFIFPPRIICFL